MKTLIITLTILALVFTGLVYVHRKPIVRVMRAWAAMQGDAGAHEFHNPTPKD